MKIATRGSLWRGAAEEMAGQDIVVLEQALAPALVQALRQEMMGLWDGGAFDAARVGMGQQRQLVPSVRRDWIHWFEERPESEPQRLLMAQLEEIRAAINLHSFLGLFDVEAHYAIYPPGSFYKRHVDVFQQQAARKVTFILYLNPDWMPGDGGELRVYEDGQSARVRRDVAPLGGTLVLFLSELVHHEVLESRTQRCSVTGWFRTRG